MDWFDTKKDKTETKEDENGMKQGTRNKDSNNKIEKSKDDYEKEGQLKRKESMHDHDMWFNDLYSDLVAIGELRLDEFKYHDWKDSCMKQVNKQCIENCIELLSVCDNVVRYFTRKDDSRFNFEQLSGQIVTVIAAHNVWVTEDAYKIVLDKIIQILAEMAVQRESEPNSMAKAIVKNEKERKDDGWWINSVLKLSKMQLAQNSEIDSSTKQLLAQSQHFPESVKKYLIYFLSLLKKIIEHEKNGSGQKMTANDSDQPSFRVSYAYDGKHCSFPGVPAGDATFALTRLIIMIANKLSDSEKPSESSDNKNNKVAK